MVTCGTMAATRGAVAWRSVATLALLAAVASVVTRRTCSFTFGSCEAVRATSQAGSCSWIAFGAFGASARIRTPLSPRALWAWLLTSLSRVTGDADALAGLGIASGGVCAIALALPAATGAVGEGGAGNAAVASVPPRRTLAVAEVAVAPAAGTVVGTPLVASGAEEAERTHVVAAVSSARVTGAAAASRLGVAQGVTFARAFFLAADTVGSLGASLVAKNSTVSRMTAACFGERIALSLLTVRARVLAFVAEESGHAVGRFASPSICGDTLTWRAQTLERAWQVLAAMHALARELFTLVDICARLAVVHQLVARLAGAFRAI